MWAGSEPKQEQHNNRPYRYVYTTVRDTRFGNLLTWHIYLLAHAAPSRQHSEWTVSKYHLLMQLITLASSSNQERKSRFVPPFNAAADASCSHSNGPIRRERGLASKSNRTAGLFFYFYDFLIYDGFIYIREDDDGIFFCRLCTISGTLFTRDGSRILRAFFFGTIGLFATVRMGAKSRQHYWPCTVLIALAKAKRKGKTQTK